MKKNMGIADRIIRLIISAVFAALYFTGTVSGVFGVTLLVLGGIFTLTALLGFCPLYAIFGLSSCQSKEKTT